MILRRRGQGGQPLIEMVVLIVGITGALGLLFSHLRAAVAHRMKSGASGYSHNLLKH